MPATITPLPNVIVPIFRSDGFDAEATQNLGKAYDIACHSLHPKGRPPVLQEALAKNIVEAFHSAVSVIPTGSQRSLWVPWARFIAT
jgi:hypothetical protein